MMRCFPADESDFESDLYSRFLVCFRRRIHVSVPLCTHFVPKIDNSAEGGIRSDYSDSDRASGRYCGDYLHYSLDFYVQEVGEGDAACSGIVSREKTYRCLGSWTEHVYL